ncbi:MAG: carbohydrate kinase family protein [Deltaproteobacteria bacterium]|nr:carbohydrate kinase family protein [Deltaproteobacteria bacterium]
MKTATKKQDKRQGILAAGNFIIDRVAIIDRYPPQDDCAAILSTKHANGGAPFNALCDWARMGVKFPIAAAGCVGRDTDGDWIFAECKRLKINTKQLHRATNKQTSYSEILTESGTGRRTIFHHPGANAAFAPKVLDLKASGAKIFFLGFIGLLACMDAADSRFGTRGARLLAEARKRGMCTAADVVTDRTGALPRLTKAALPYLDYFFCNEIELEILTGVPTRSKQGKLDKNAIEKAAAKMRKIGRGLCMVVHAAEAAVALTADGQVHWHGSVRVPSENIVGTNGAGDAFLAGFLAATHDGKAPSACLEQGVCVAAASLFDSTPSAGVRDLRSCLKLGRRFGFRAG